MQQTITTKDVGAQVNLKVAGGNSPVTAVVQAVEVRLVYRVIVENTNVPVDLAGDLIV